MTRDAEGVEHSQYSGEGSLCLLGITKPKYRGYRVLTTNTTLKLRYYGKCVDFYIYIYAFSRRIQVTVSTFYQLLLYLGK